MSSSIPPENPLAYQVIGPPSRRYFALVFGAVLLATLVVYSRSFQVLPASDDFPIVNEVHRGNQEGVGVFFTDSIIRIGYRPLKSLVIWACGNLAHTRPMAAVRVANLLGLAICGLVVVLWSCSIRLSRAGTLAAICLIFLHPVFTAAVASCDGIDTVMSTALLWLGAWGIYTFRDRLLPAAAWSLGCLVVGVGFKENLFALVPLAAWAIWMFWSPQTRWRHGVALLIALVVTALAVIVLRQYVIEGGISTGASMLKTRPQQYAMNAGQFLTGLLFFGDTIWVYVNQSPQVLALVAAAMAIAFALISAGLAWRARIEPTREARKWILFLFVGLIIASFPTILLHHVSEMYVPPMLPALALLCGLAADGWRAGAPKFARVGALVMCAVALVSSISAIRHKVDGLIDVGRRAEAQLTDVLSFVPPGTREKSIMLLFRAADLPARRTYSVFRMGDEILLVHEIVPKWHRPDDKLRLQSRIVEEFDAFDLREWDYVLGWDVNKQRFTRIK